MATADSTDGPMIVDDLLVTRAPIGKMTWVEAVRGCPVAPKLDAGSIYSEPYLDGPDQTSRLPAPADSPWLELLKEYTWKLVEDSGGRYQIVQCLQRGPIGLISALLCHSEMCYAIDDDPVELRALMQACMETFIMVAKAQEAGMMIVTRAAPHCQP